MESIKLGENHNGRSRPSIKVPLGEFIMSRTPQLVIAPFTFDHTGSPICVEAYKFRPGQVFKELTMDEYILYLTYCLEYKSTILEQQSLEREQAFLDSLSEEDRILALSDEEGKFPPFGILAGNTVIRDLEGIGFDHMGSQGKEIIKAVMNLASDNYPGPFWLHF